MTITDHELCERVSPELADDYKFALQFMQLDPETSLTKFRRMVELLCILIGEAQKIEYSTHELSGRIRELFEYQVINYSQNAALHRLRSLGNEAVHVSSTRAGKGINKEDVKDLIQEERQRLQKEALLAQSLIIEIVQDLYPQIIKEPLGHEVKLTKLVDESWKSDLVSYITSENYKDKLKAGHIYTRLAIDLAVDDSFEQNIDFICTNESILKMAIANYEAACNLSSKIDAKKLSISNLGKIAKDSNPHTWMMKKADPECLFYLWDALVTYKFTEYEIFGDISWMLKRSAKKGFPKAMARYADKLYEAGDSRAKEWVLKAAEHEEDLAMLLMCRMVFEERKKSGENIDIHLEPLTQDFQDIENPTYIDYLMRGVELGGPECLCALGQMYHRLEDDRAEEVLLASIKNGSVEAFNYYFQEFKGLSTIHDQKVLKTLQDMGDLAEQSFNRTLENFTRCRKPIVKDETIGRNDPCVCGSGKKYKKCCLN